MSPKWKFVLTYGLGWGLCTFVTIIAWNVLIRHNQFTWIDVAIGLPIWSLGGLAWGNSMWAWFEKRRRKTSR
jgi:hypothetical protein